VDRARLGLIPGLTVAVAVLALSACGYGAPPAPAPPLTQSSAAAPGGYPLPVGQRFTVSDDGKSKLAVRVGDIVVGPDVPDAVRIGTESGVLAYAENTPDGPAFQAVKPGRAVVLVGEAPAPATCATPPCAGRTPPPTVTVEVS
jgi:hypothetical protein